MVTKFKEGDVLSESSHYIVGKERSNGNISVTHQESGDTVYLGKEYIHKYLQSADDFSEVVKVTKEDKKDGTKGIRSIFEGIHSSQVFTVCFTKQDKPKSQRKFNEEINTLVNSFSEEIDAVQKSKKGVANAAKQFIEHLLKNPILPYEEGEERVLRGFKIQFESRDGRYNCIDMDIQEENGIRANIRPVNINTIRYLIYGGVKYVVE